MKGSTKFSNTSDVLLTLFCMNILAAAITASFHAGHFVTLFIKKVFDYNEKHSTIFQPLEFIKTFFPNKNKNNSKKEVYHRNLFVKMFCKPEN